jgi:hypothetical protein
MYKLRKGVTIEPLRFISITTDIIQAGLDRPPKALR